MSATDSTFLLLVAKWPCQKRVSFSRSGSGPWRMRLSQQTLSRSRFDERPRRLAQAIDRLGVFGGELGRVEQPRRRWPRGRPRGRGAAPPALRRSRRGGAGGRPCGGPTGRPASARSEPRGNRFVDLGMACLTWHGLSTALAPHPAFGHPLPEGEGLFAHPHCACGFSIRISPRSSVSPGLTVKSLRICDSLILVVDRREVDDPVQRAGDQDGQGDAALGVGDRAVPVMLAVDVGHECRRRPPARPGLACSGCIWLGPGVATISK